MNVDGQLNRSRAAFFAALTPNIAGKGGFLHTSMDSSFFEGLKGGSLGMGQTGLGAAFGKGPAPASSPDQQKLDSASANPVADGSHLFASAQPAKV